MKGVQLVEFSQTCAGLSGYRVRLRHMNHCLNSSRSSRFYGGVGLLSSHIVCYTVYVRGVYRLLEEALPQKLGGIFDLGRKSINRSWNSLQGIPIGTSRLEL